MSKQSPKFQIHMKKLQKIAGIHIQRYSKVTREMDKDMTILRNKKAVELTLFEKYVVKVLLDEIDLIFKMQAKLIKSA